MKVKLHKALCDQEVSLELESGEEEIVTSTYDTPTVAKVAKQIYESGGIEFSKYDRGMLLSPSLDGNKKFHVSLPQRECECKHKNGAHLRAVYFHYGFADDFGMPPKVRARCLTAGPKQRKAKTATSGKKAPRLKDTNTEEEK
jgi:hypothetical protein